MAENPDFGTFGRYRETPVNRMPADMRAAYDDTLKLRGLVPVPHKIWLANPAYRAPSSRRAPITRPSRP